MEPTKLCIITITNPQPTLRCPHIKLRPATGSHMAPHTYLPWGLG